MLPNRSTEPDIPRYASDVKCLKADRMEGERERKVELEKKEGGRGTGKTRTQR